MSDFEDYFDEDEDEFEYWDEDQVGGVAGLAADLAEHTVQSPVWHEAHHGDESGSDFGYETDEYYDQDRGLRKPNAQGTMAEDRQRSERERVGMDHGPGEKRRKLESLDDSQLSLQDDRPLVKYRSRVSPERSPPIVEPGGLEKVAILKDWRERFSKEDHRVSGERNGVVVDEYGAADAMITDGADLGRKNPRKQDSKSRKQDRVVRKRPEELPTRTITTRGRLENAPPPPLNAARKPHQPIDSKVATSVANSATSLPNGRRASRKRKEPDSQPEQKADDMPVRKKAAVNQDTAKNANAVAGTAAATARGTRSVKAARK